MKEMTVETGYDYHKKIFDTCEAMMRLVGQVTLVWIIFLRNFWSNSALPKILRYFSETLGVTLPLPQIPVPVIGVVTGHAAAAGCQLIASCDLVNNCYMLVSCSLVNWV